MNTTSANTVDYVRPLPLSPARLADLRLQARKRTERLIEDLLEDSARGDLPDQMDRTVYYTHFPVAEGMCTVAYLLDNDRRAEDRKLLFAPAFCSPKDMFNKRLGRERARRALLYDWTRERADAFNTDQEAAWSEVSQKLEHVRGKSRLVNLYIENGVSFWRQVSSLIRTYVTIGSSAPSWTRK